MTISKIRVPLTVAFAHLPNVSVRVQAVYVPADPYAVQLRFPSSAGRADTTEWVFARSLLAQGMDPLALTPAGDGDITVGPAEADDYVEIVLHPHAPERTRLFARRDELSSFLANTYMKVPDEQEDHWIDWAGAWSWLRRCVLEAGGAV
ncbi:SsgA family sporulation/cell division regulator [Nonomuraea sp. NPDC048882]|uniref:SsgA family sporulation/cell division regulator n=1 Tax=Nonomuraea sp. NPDC048882 TaxID=3154347 RepID=UPI0033F08022